METTARHPFLAGLSKHRGAPPTAVVIFGASGDLTARKLIPAIYNLAYDNLLPSDFHLIGFGRSRVPDDEFRKLAVEAIAQFSRRPFQEDIWRRIGEHTFYEAGGYDEPGAFDRLRERIESIEKTLGHPVQSLFYVSTPPSVFRPILENLGASGLARRHTGSRSASKVVIDG